MLQAGKKSSTQLNFFYHSTRKIFILKMLANNFKELVKELEKYRKQPFHNYQQNYAMAQNPEQVNQFQP